MIRRRMKSARTQVSGCPELACSANATLTGGIAMFEPKENPGFDKMSADARDMVAAWFRNDWYESSSTDTSAHDAGR